VLGPSTQKQADRSRQAQQADTVPDLDSSSWGAESDGGRNEIEQKNGLDVIR
jgi:cell division protein FtsZ